MAAKVLSKEEKTANLLAVVVGTLAELRGANFQTRRRAIMYVAAVLGHRMKPENLRDQPWGCVGQCENCGQVAKTARDGTIVEGRATFTLCPAASL